MQLPSTRAGTFPVPGRPHSSNFHVALLENVFFCASRARIRDSEFESESEPVEDDNRTTVSLLPLSSSPSSRADPHDVQGVRSAQHRQIRFTFCTLSLTVRLNTVAMLLYLVSPRRTRVPV